jgi:hypothetical protein
MVRLEFGYHEHKPKIFRRTAKSGQYLSIGWTRQGRQELNVAASNTLSELEDRNLSIRKMTVEEKDKIGHFQGNSPVNCHSCIMDSSGIRDASFRKSLRKYCNNLPSLSPSTMHYDPVMIYSAAAMKAIDGRMKELRSLFMPFHEVVGDKFIISTITPKQGFKIYSEEQLQAIDGLFDIGGR